MEKLTFSQTGDTSLMAESAFGDYRIWMDHHPMYADMPELLKDYEEPMHGIIWAFLGDTRLYAGFDIDEAFQIVTDDFAWRIGK